MWQKTEDDKEDQANPSYKTEALLSNARFKGEMEM